jgi:hypothetical protein
MFYGNVPVNVDWLSRQETDRLHRLLAQAVEMAQRGRQQQRRCGRTRCAAVLPGGNQVIEFRWCTLR